MLTVRGMPVIFADTPSMGMLIGLPIAALLLLACLVAALYGVGLQRSTDTYAASDGRLLTLAAGGAATVVILIAAASFYPFKHDYHFWVDKGGTVTEVSKRLVPAGDSGMQEKFVFTIDGRPYAVLDTRAALVKPGDKVRIRCKRVHEWGTPQAANGWDCKWAGVAE